MLEAVALSVDDELAFHLADTDTIKFFIREGVKDDLINVYTVKGIYAYACDHYERTGSAPHIAVLQTEFPKFEFAEPSSSAQWVVDTLKKRYKRNEVAALALKLGDLHDRPDEAFMYLQEKSHEIQRNTISTRYVFGPDSYKDFLADMKHNIAMGAFRGVTTGFKQVDEFTGGLKPGYLAFLCARPKRKKTFVLLKAFIEQVRAGSNPILFTLENTPQEIMNRIQCMISGFPWDLAQRGILMPNDYKMLENAWEEFNSYGSYHIASPPIGSRTVPALMLEAEKHDAGSILISQFRYIEGMKQFNIEHEKYAQNVVDLKSLATRQGYEVPVYVEAQFNRGAEKLSDISDSNLGQLGLTDVIGQASDVVYAIVQNKDMKEVGMSQFGIVAARNHDTNEWFFTSEFKEETQITMLNKVDIGSFET